MHFYFDQAAMMKSLQKIERVVPLRSPLQILQGIHMKLSGNKLVLTATDLDLGIKTELNVKGLKDGEAVIPEKIVAVVRSLPPGATEICLDYETMAVALKQENINFKLRCFNPEEYPPFPGEEEDIKKLKISGFLFKEMLKKTLFAVSTDASKPVFNGINFNFAAENMRVAASDTFRLALYKVEVKINGGENVVFTLPTKAMKEFERIIEDEDIIEMGIFKGQVIFSFGVTTLVTRMLENKFPDVFRVVPQDFLTRISVNKNLFEMALERAGLLAEKEIHAVNLSIFGGEIVVSASSSLGNNKETLSLLSFKGENVDIIMNIKFLTEVIKVLKDDKVDLSFRGAAGPVVITTERENNYLYLALPIKPK